MFCVNQHTNSLNDAKTHTSSLASRLLKGWGDELLVYDISAGDTQYLKPLMLALYQTCHHSSNSSAKIARALATRLDVANTLNNLRNIGLLESA